MGNPPSNAANGSREAPGSADPSVRYAVDDVPHVDLLEALDDMGQLIPLVTEHKE